MKDKDIVSEIILCYIFQLNLERGWQLNYEELMSMYNSNKYRITFSVNFCG